MNGSAIIWVIFENSLKAAQALRQECNLKEFLNSIGSIHVGLLLLKVSYSWLLIY